MVLTEQPLILIAPTDAICRELENWPSYFLWCFFILKSLYNKLTMQEFQIVNDNVQKRAVRKDFKSCATVNHCSVRLTST